MDAASGSSARRERRLAAYLDTLAEAAGHADRAIPLTVYCTGLLVPGSVNR